MNRTRQIVIFALIATTIACLPTLLFVPVSERAEQYINILVGFFIAKAGDAINWLLGSTEASGKRNEAQGEALTKLADAATVTAAVAAANAPNAGGATMTVQPPAHVEITEGEKP